MIEVELDWPLTIVFCVGSSDENKLNGAPSKYYGHWFFIFSLKFFLAILCSFLMQI
jgi:hypothetical protein